MQREQAFFPLLYGQQRNPCRPLRWNKVCFAIPSARSLDARQVRNTAVAYRVLVKYLHCIPTQRTESGGEKMRKREKLGGEEIIIARSRNLIFRGQLLSDKPLQTFVNSQSFFIIYHQLVLLLNVPSFENVYPRK